MSKLSIEQISDHLSGLPNLIDLEQEAGTFLQIFKIYKVVRSLADMFGEIFIDWQVKDTVAVSFADHQLKPLIVMKWLKMDHLVGETVERYHL